MKTQSTEYLQEMLIALNDLRRKYMGEEQSIKYGDFESTDSAERCPLCNISSLNRAYTDYCFNCPWTWFTEGKCYSQVLDWSIPQHATATEQRTVLDNNLFRITDWENRIKDELRSRGVEI